MHFANEKPVLIWAWHEFRQTAVERPHSLALVICSLSADPPSVHSLRPSNVQIHGGQKPELLGDNNRYWTPVAQSAPSTVHA